MGNWARIHQRSGKTSNEVTKRRILTKGKFRQISDKFCKDDEFGREVIKGLTKIYREMTKRGILTNGDYKKKKKTNWATIHLRFAKIQIKWDDERDISIIVSFTKMTNLARFIKSLVKIKTRWRNRHFHNCGFNENDKCCKIHESGKDSSKAWENCLLIISENSNFG